MSNQLGKEYCMNTIVYHGATQIVEHPLCKLGRPNLDFGQGFYVTDMKEQAVRWAETVALRRGEKPLLNVYRLDREAVMAEARCKIFTAYDKEWLRFIVRNREGHNLAAEYDYIEGGVADDRVIDTIKFFIGGIMDEQSALRQLAFHKPNNQICIANQDILDRHLTYDRTISI